MKKFKNVMISVFFLFTISFSATYHVTVAGAGAKDGAAKASAFGYGEWETFMEGSVAAGDIIYVYGGAYTLTSAFDFSARPGTMVAPIVIIGVAAATTNDPPVLSDWSTTHSTRPIFDGATYTFRPGAYTTIRNLSFESDYAYPVWAGNYDIFENCRFVNDSPTSAAEYCANSAIGAQFINCEFMSATTGGVLANGSNRFLYSFFHGLSDATNGKAIVGNANIVVDGCIFDSCMTGISSVSMDNGTVKNNTFFVCDTVLSETDGNGWTVANNILDLSNKVGFKWTTQTNSNFFWKNHGDDTRNTDMWLNVAETGPSADLAATTGDPLFTTAGSDFSLQLTSPCIDTALGISLGVGN